MALINIWSVVNSWGGVADATPPVITLLGSETVNLTVADTYSDAGATATDNVDGDITNNIVVVNPVDVNTASTYTITYNVSDAAGNAAAEVTRTVIVSEAVDTTAPVITVSIPGPITITLNEAFTPPTATATDNTDGDISNDIVIVNNVDNTTLGQYTVTYNVSDAAGNAAQTVTVTVNVVDADALAGLIAEAVFSVPTDRTLAAFAGRLNKSLVQFKLESDTPEVDTINGLFDFDANNVIKVEVISSNGLIDSDSNAVSFAGNELIVELGALNEQSSTQAIAIVAYIGTDTKGIVLAGAGLDSCIYVAFN